MNRKAWQLRLLILQMLAAASLIACPWLAAAWERGESWLAYYGGRVSSEWSLPKLWQMFTIFSTSIRLISLPGRSLINERSSLMALKWMLLKMDTFA